MSGSQVMNHFYLRPHVVQFVYNRWLLLRDGDAACAEGRLKLLQHPLNSLVFSMRAIKYAAMGGHVAVLVLLRQSPRTFTARGRALGSAGTMRPWWWHRAWGEAFVAAAQYDQVCVLDWMLRENIVARGPCAYDSSAVYYDALAATVHSGAAGAEEWLRQQAAGCITAAGLRALDALKQDLRRRRAPARRRTFSSCITLVAAGLVVILLCGVALEPPHSARLACGSIVVLALLLGP